MNDRRDPAHHHLAHPSGDDGHATVKDPVCGMMVDPERTEHHVEHGGRTFHFCSAR